jgi:uncharacterized protein (DUF58 family)
MMKQQKYGKAKIAALLVITYIFAKFQGGFASWFLFYSSLTFFVYQALAYLLMFASLQVTREIDRNRLKDGEDVVVTLRLRRKIWFPLGWNMVVEPLPDKISGYYHPHRQIVYPWFKREIEVKYVIPSLPRGYYELKDCVVTGGDFFGFIQRTKTFALYNEFLVYPSYRQLTHWPTGDGNRSGNIHVVHRRSDDVAAVRGVRDYHRGDRLSQIHWRASARGQGMKTKEFEHQAMNQVVFFLDLEKRHYKQEETQLFEMAVSLTASLVNYSNRRNFHYGLIARQKERIHIPPANSQAHFFRVFDQLARVMPEGEENFSRVLGREALEYSQGTTIAVITPSLEIKMVSRLLELAHAGRSVHLFFVHTAPTLSSEVKHTLQMLAVNKVVSKSVHPMEFEDLKRIGGA